MRQVFISYSRINLEAVTQLVNDLREIGVEPWHDQTLTGGQRWWDSILAQIRGCDLFIFALSPESWASEACRSELNYVAQLGRPILPVLVSDGVNLNRLTRPLNELQVTDYRLRDKRATLALIKAINTSPQAPPLPDPLPPPPDVPSSYVVTLQERIDAPGPLSAQEQNLIFDEIKEKIDQGRSLKEMKELLLCLSKRDDLFKKVGDKIEALLESLEDRQPRQQPPPQPMPLVPQRREQPDPQPGNAAQPSGPRACPKCGTQHGEGARFCGSCGTKLPESACGPNVSTRPGWQGCQYVCAPGDIQRVINDIVGWLTAKGFESKQKDTGGQGLLIEVEKKGEWRNLVGMATSLNILFNHSGNTLTVEVGEGKWADKAAGGAVGMFLLPPLAFTAGYGAWEQLKMPERIFEYVGTRLDYK